MAATSESKNSTHMSVSPIVKNIEEENNILTFTVSNSNVSFINAIRRVLLSEISTVVFRTAPYDKSMTTIHSNTTRLTNEIFKQRLSCVPIHITDPSIDLNTLVVELDKQNESDMIEYVTTEDFKIKDKTTDKYLPKRVVHQYFPPNPITGDYIILNRLRPKISDTIPGEMIQLEAQMTRTTAREDSCFNVTSTCSYSYAQDPVKQESTWKTMSQELRKKGMDDDEIEFERKNWYLNDAKRIFTPNTFDFKLGTIGVYTNQQLIHNASNVMLSKCESLMEQLTTQQISIEPSKTTMPYAFDITLENEDYTIGKCVEYVLHDLFYKNKKYITFVGFLKSHPYDADSIIRVQMDSGKATKNEVNLIVLEAVSIVRQYYESLKSQF